MLSAAHEIRSETNRQSSVVIFQYNYYTYQKQTWCYWSFIRTLLYTTQLSIAVRPLCCTLTEYERFKTIELPELPVLPASNKENNHIFCALLVDHHNEIEWKQQKKMNEIERDREWITGKMRHTCWKSLYSPQIQDKVCLIFFFFLLLSVVSFVFSSSFNFYQVEHISL